MKYPTANSLFIVLSLWIFFFSDCQKQKKTQTSTSPDLPAYTYYMNSSKYVEVQDYQRGLAALDTAISLKPEVSTFYFAKGQIYEIMGENKAAIAEYENSLLYKSYFPDCWLKLAVLYMDYNQPEKATQMLKNLTEYLPDSLSYELMLADAYVADKKAMLALERVTYFESQGGSSPETNRIKGLAYFHQNNNNEKTIKKRAQKPRWLTSRLSRKNQRKIKVLQKG